MPAIRATRGGRRASAKATLAALIICTGLLTLAGGATPAAGDAPELMTGRGAVRVGVSATVIRERSVDVDTDLLCGFERTRVGGTALLNFFDDAAFLARFDRVHERMPGLESGTTWSGTLADDQLGWFVLTLQREVVTASLWTGDGRTFHIRTGADGEYLAQETDTSALDPCGGVSDLGPLAPADEQDAAARGGDGCADDGSVIDVMVVYTTAARTEAGGVAQIQGHIANSIGATNVAYVNSEIITSVRLVHTAEVDYIELATSTDLGRLRDTSDGYMDEVHAWRDQYRADLVALVSVVGGGQAYLMTVNSPASATKGFSVSRYDYPLVFAHELGHNQGCCHAPGDVGGCENGGLYPYSWGHHFLGNSGREWGTLMSYRGAWFSHFSNPSVFYDGQPTGLSDRNNARTINEAAWAVANFRPRLFVPIVTQQPASQTICRGRSVTFGVTAFARPLPRYQWQKDAVNIAGATGSTYTISSAATAHAGSYQAIVTNACGTVASDAANLTIQALPRDLNCDCVVNGLDIAPFVECLLTTNCPACAPQGIDLPALLDCLLTGNCPAPALEYMLLVPAGEFRMGDHHDGQESALPLHTVSVNAFYMGRYEVTNREYAEALNWAWGRGDGLISVTNGIVYKPGATNYPYCGITPTDFGSQITWSGSTFGVTAGKEDHPMVDVSWYGSVAYCNWRSTMQHREPCYTLTTWACDFARNGYRLPTEAEWEKAARGGQYNPYRRYPWGDSLNGSKANYEASGDPFETGAYPWTTPVGYYNGGQTPLGGDMANGYGLYDMSGNVWEWCGDWWSDTYYSSSPFNDPRGPDTGAYRVFRGGSWKYDDRYLRCAYRGINSPVRRSDIIGFRLALGSD